MAELIREFDVTDSDAVLKIFPLKFGDAEEVGTVIGLMLNVNAPGGALPKASSSSGGGGGSPPMPMPGPMGMERGMPGGPSSGGGGSPPASGIGSTVSAPQVRIWPDRTSNRLIVSAPKSKLIEFNVSSISLIRISPRMFRCARLPSRMSPPRTW